MSTIRRITAMALVAATIAGAAILAASPQLPVYATRAQTAPIPDAQARAIEAAASRQPAAPVPVPQRPGAPNAANTGVYALTNGGSIMIIDARTFLTYGPFLEGELGTIGGGLFDVVMTKNGTRAVVSNFGDSQIHLIDLHVPGAPVHLGTADIPYFAEDMAISPNQKYMLVTDGGFSPRVVAVNIATGAVVGDVDTTAYALYSNAVAIARDGQTVITADYFTPAIGVIGMNPATGTLSYINTITTGTMRPVNIAISPDGRTGVAVGCNPDGDPEPGDPVIAMGTALRIMGPGAVILGGEIQAPDVTTIASQSAVFSRDGRKLYWLAAKAWTGDPLDDPGVRQHVVYVYDVVSPGILGYTGIEIPLQDWGGSSCLFGVDAMSIDPKNEFLYVSNPTVSGGRKGIAVVDLRTNRQVLTLVGAPLPAGEDKIPTGIAFK